MANCIIVCTSGIVTKGLVTNSNISSTCCIRGETVGTSRSELTAGVGAEGIEAVGSVVVAGGVGVEGLVTVRSIV